MCHFCSTHFIYINTNVLKWFTQIKYILDTKYKNKNNIESNAKENRQVFIHPSSRSWLVDPEAFPGLWRDITSPPSPHSSSDLLPAFRAKNSSLGRHPAGISARCPNHLWLLSTQRHSSPTPSLLHMTVLLTLMEKPATFLRKHISAYIHYSPLWSQ